MEKSWATTRKLRKGNRPVAFFNYKHQGYLSGRVTTDDNFTSYVKPELDENAQNVPEGDLVAQPDAGVYYVPVDPSGKLGWKSCTLTYGDTIAHVLEILTGRASKTYKASLRRLGISYIVAGETQLDHGLAMENLKVLFYIETPMLDDGGIPDWSYIQAGICDEISIVIAAAADGSHRYTYAVRRQREFCPVKSVGIPTGKRRRERR
jgi:riboflavin biosynthesis pyrimidine reductase